MEIKKKKHSGNKWNKDQKRSRNYQGTHELVFERWTLPLTLSTCSNVRREQWRRTPKAFLTPRPPWFLFPPERRHSLPSKQETRPGLTSQHLVGPIPATPTVLSFRLSLLAPSAQSHLRRPLSHDWLALFISRWNSYLFVCLLFSSLSSW